MEDSASRSSYKEILKNTSIFGGVQVFIILVTILRSKIVAVLLGPAGVGINALFNSVIQFIGALSNLGLATSAVKDVAQYYGKKDEGKVAETVVVIKRWVWVTGIFGTLIVFLGAPFLSQMIFGSIDYLYSLLLISIVLLITQLGNGQLIILRGLRRVKPLAKAQAFGALLALLFSTPLYYYYGIKGIIPAIVLTAISNLFCAWYFSNKVTLGKINVSLRDTWIKGKDMLRLGFFISLGGITTLGCQFLIRAFISNQGDLADVGLFNAGFSVVNGYVGLVFNAMAVDYFPRLSAVADRASDLWGKEINNQFEISILILGPILAVLILGIEWVVILLYSDEFLKVIPFVQWSAIGIIFKAASWALGFLLLAKKNSKYFLIGELMYNAVFFTLAVTSYQSIGLLGIGYAFIISYVLYLLFLVFACKALYGFSFSRRVSGIFIGCLVLVSLSLVIFHFYEGVIFYFFSFLLVTITVTLSYVLVSKQINLKEIIMNKIKRS